MKIKILALLLLLVMLVSCGSTASTDTTDSADTTDTPSVYDESTAIALLEMMRPSVEAEQLTVYIDPLPITDAELFSYHFFVKPNKSITEAAICQPTNGVTPFFLGILKVSSEKEAKALADDVYDNIDYRKLICTTFEKAYTRAVGKTVILILDGDAERADRMLALWEALPDKS